MVPDILSIIKQAAMDAVDNSQPMAVLFGTVKTEEPLEIAIDQKTVLTKEFLVVPEHLTDREVEVTVKPEYGLKTQNKSGGSGESSFSSHNHDITASGLKILIHGRLKAGNKVALLRAPGGQKFLVYDRVK